MPYLLFCKKSAWIRSAAYPFPVFFVCYQNTDQRKDHINIERVISFWWKYPCGSSRYSRESKILSQ